MGEEETPLNELCAICHLQRPKYKCPRCTVETCSLQCVTRHKSRSQCTGTRNPAPYRKLHELSTPSSIDQDYNFITSLERELQRVDQRLERRQMALDSKWWKPVSSTARHEGKTQIRARKVLRAPPGMSRALKNKSKWHKKHHCFLWTIEWVLDDGFKGVGNSQEIRTVQEAFLYAGGKHWIEKQPTSVLAADMPDRGYHPSPAEKDKLNSAGYEKSDSDIKIYFYLHRPDVPAKIKCLIPLQANDVLRDVIRDRVLIEFPTIFALSSPPEKLQKPFITEEEYIRQHGDKSGEIGFDNLKMADTRDSGTDEVMDSDKALPQLDEKKIAEVIQRDLGA